MVEVKGGKENKVQEPSFTEKRCNTRHGSSDERKGSMVALRLMGRHKRSAGGGEILGDGSYELGTPEGDHVPGVGVWRLYQGTTEGRVKRVP